MFDLGRPTEGCWDNIILVFVHSLTRFQDFWELEKQLYENSSGITTMCKLVALDVEKDETLAC